MSVDELVKIWPENTPELIISWPKPGECVGGVHDSRRDQMIVVVNAADENDLCRIVYETLQRAKSIKESFMQQGICQQISIWSHFWRHWRAANPPQ